MLARCFFCFLILYGNLAFSQNLISLLSKEDSLFFQARNLAFIEDDLDSALIIGNKLVETNPENLDYRLFVGRIYAWKKDFYRAKLILRVSSDSLRQDWLEAMADISFWAGETDASLEICDRAISTQGISAFPFLLKKGNIYASLKKPEEALRSFKQIPDSSIEFEQAKDKIRDLYWSLSKNQVSISYQQIRYEGLKSSAGNFGTLEYKRSTKKFPWLARIHFGKIPSLSDHSIEAEGYPSIGKSTYAFVHAGAGLGSKFFPTWKGGAEIFQAIPANIEISGGARWMRFPAKEEVLLYTGSAGIYLGNYWFSYRLYGLNKSKYAHLTHAVSARKYFWDRNQFAGLYLIYGVAPYTYTFIQEITRVGSGRIGLECQISLFKMLQFRPLVLYEMEEYFPGLSRNRLNLQATFITKF